MFQLSWTMERETVCPTCGACFRLRTAYREHMKTCHGWQRVICPLCPGVKNLQNPSSLKKHIGKMHPTGVSRAAFTTQGMYFFSHHPRRYRAISTVPPESDASMKEAQRLMREWAEMTVTPEAAKLMQDIDKDWAIIAPNMKRKAEESVGETLVATNSSTENLYDLTLLDVTLSKKGPCSAEVWSTLPAYEGLLVVAYHVRATPHRSAARALDRVQELEIPAVEDTGVSCGNVEVAERAAMVLGISRADIDSITFKERCRPRNPNLPSPGAIPSMPTPSDYSDGEESLLSHPMTPLDRSPEVHRYELPKVVPGRKSVAQPSVCDLLQQAVDESELLISEGTAQEVPATDQLLADIRATASPTYNPTPLLPMPRETETEYQALPQSITMEAPPVLQPTPKLRSHATDPVPGPTFTLNSYGKVKLVQSPRSVQPTAQSQLTAEDEEALKWGGWPMMCPARRDWEAGVSVQINIPATTIEWPPRNMNTMSDAQRKFALQAVAAMVALGDQEPGHFPLSSPERLAEEYHFLALPQTGPVGANNSLSGMRQLAHCAFLDTLVSSNSRQEHDAMIEMLKAGRALGPAGRRRLLSQVNEAGVPLFPLQPPKGQSGSHLKPIASPTQDQAVPAKKILKSPPSGATRVSWTAGRQPSSAATRPYSPTMPGLDD